MPFSMKTMPVAPDLAQIRLFNNQTEAHPFCFVCSGSNPMGLALRYEPQPDGSVSAKFLGHSALEGYSGLLHGGVIAAMLDGAMTNCLFAHGIAALTAEMKVRYRHPVRIGQPVLILARIVQSSSPLFVLESQITQSGLQCAGGTGKFMQVST